MEILLHKSQSINILIFQNIPLSHVLLTTVIGEAASYLVNLVQFELQSS